MFGLSNFIITEFLLIFYSLVTNVLYSYKELYLIHSLQCERIKDIALLILRFDAGLLSHPCVPWILVKLILAGLLRTCMRPLHSNRK